MMMMMMQNCCSVAVCSSPLSVNTADSVYINAELTPAESLAAFQERECQRARRSTQHNSGLANPIKELVAAAKVDSL